MARVLCLRPPHQYDSHYHHIRLLVFLKIYQGRWQALATANLYGYIHMDHIDMVCELYIVDFDEYVQVVNPITKAARQNKAAACGCIWVRTSNEKCPAHQ